MEELRLWEKALTKLSFIEQRVARFGRFDLGNGLQDSDLQKIEDLYMVVTTGEYRKEMSFEFELKNLPRFPKKEAKGITEARADGGKVKLLGLTILLGDARVTWDDPNVAVMAFENAATARSKTVRIASSWVTWAYLDWGPSKEGPRSGTSGATAAQKSRSGTPTVPSARTLAKRRPKS